MAHASEKSKKSMSCRVTRSSGRKKGNHADTVRVASMMHHMAVPFANPTTVAVTFVGLNHSQAFTHGLQCVAERDLNVVDAFAADLSAMLTSTFIVSGTLSQVKDLEKELNSVGVECDEAAQRPRGESPDCHWPPAFRTEGDAVLDPLEVGLSVTMPHRPKALVTVMQCLDERKFQVLQLSIIGDHPRYTEHKRVRMWLTVPRESQGPVTDEVLCELQTALAEKVRSSMPAAVPDADHWELERLEDQDRPALCRVPRASVN
jgi:hypothetical protein